MYWWDKMISEKLELNQQNLINYVNENGFVSFAEIQRDFKDTEGERYIHVPNMPNLVTWWGVSEKFITEINKLFMKSYGSKPCSILVYMADGQCLNLPLAKKIKNYNEPHWLPIIIDKEVNLKK